MKNSESMPVKFDKYIIVRNRNGTVDSVQFYSGKSVHSYAYPKSVGVFLRKYEVKQKDLAKMAHRCDVWCKILRRF